MILNIKAASRLQIPEITAVFEGYTSEDAANLTQTYDNTYFGSCIPRSLLTAVIICDKIVRGVVVCNESRIPDSCEISALYISEPYQRNGFGKKLLSHALREMRAKHYKTAFLWVNETNTAAADFFKKFGFISDGKRQRDPERNDDSYECRYRIDI